MTWLYYSLLSALTKTAQNFAEKKGQKQIGSFLTFFLLMLISTLFFIPLVVFKPLPLVNWSFWLGVFGSVTVYLVAKPMQLFAFGIGDLSEVVPLISFNSLFSLIFAWIFLKEVPTSWGLLGVALIAFGGYLMNFDDTQIGAVNKITHPIKYIFKNRYQSYLFLSVILVPISGIFDKFAINNTFPHSPHYVVFMESLILVFLLAPILIIRKVKFGSLKTLSGWRVPFVLGLIYAVGSWLTFLAMSLGNLGYVSAIGKLSNLLTVLLSYFILKEGNLKKRLTSATIMGAGALLIAYLG